MSNFIKGPNIGLAIGRQGQVVGSMPWNVVYITKDIIDLNCFYRGGEQVYPLYLYAEDGTRNLNLRKSIVDEIEKIVSKVSPADIIDYIYAILHMNNYREKYKELLKSNYPRIPYPKDSKTFKALVACGAELRSLHLLESPKLNRYITTYPIAGDSKIEKIAYKGGKAFINTNQYFGGIPEDVWNFYIGGYQPAQKWLKDRKTRTLTNEDIVHYQKMIVAVSETIRIMNELDKLKASYPKSVGKSMGNFVQARCLC